MEELFTSVTQAGLLFALAVAAVVNVLLARRQPQRPFSIPEEAVSFIEQARKCYLKHAGLEGQDHITSEHQLRTCLLELNLRPSQVLVNDLMRRSLNNGEDESKNSGDGEDRTIGVGDFVLFAQLIKSYREGAAQKRQRVAADQHRLVPRSGSIDSPAYGTRQRTQYQVFLGGSCNPTTWRKDIAVPALKEAGITYYNPQMDDWTPQLVEIEAQAKLHAQIKFFVIDNRTRGIASMVEIANLVASQTQIVVVMLDFEHGGCIDGVTLSDREVVDLNRGHDFLCHLLHQHGIPLFDDVGTALEHCIRLIHTGQSIFDVPDIPYVAEPIIRGADISMMDKMNATFRQYDEHQTGSLSVKEAQLAIQSLMGIWVTLEEFAVLLSMQTLPDKDFRLTRNQFSCVVASLVPLVSMPAPTSTLQSILSLVLSTSTMNWLFPHQSTTLEYDVTRDVFLGGGCGPKQQWREEIAIPLLRKRGLDYFNPNVENWTPQLIPLEAQAKKACSVLLYYIGSDTRSIGNMVEAAYFIGKGREVVLCLNDVNPSCQIDDDELGARGAKDLNRGRLYLADVANRQNVKIFNDVSEAVMEVVHLVEAQRSSGVTRSASSTPPPISSKGA